MYYIGPGYDHETKINSSSQFNYKKSQKCNELKRLLNEKSYKMKSIVQIITQSLYNNVEYHEFSNHIIFSKTVLLTPPLNNNQNVNFVKNILSKNDLED